MDQRHSQATNYTVAESGVYDDPSRTLKGAKKQRALQACESCRVRKVRCNVGKQGVPCTNCSIDELPCLVSESRRKRRKTTDDRLSAPIEQDIVVPQSILTPSDHLDASQETTDSQNVAKHYDGLFLHGQVPLATMQPDMALPAYIKPLPDRFGADDITYLRSKGALAIPEDRLRDELLQCYAAHVYPLMPLLDLPSFMQCIGQRDAGHHVSLLLFQAVMFSGIATADIQILNHCGYNDRREARRTFFNRVRLLYDLDYEDDSMALVQALLLMTYWREEPNARKETHHWIEIAVSLAQKIGLNHEPEESGRIDASQKLRKRIWWCAYVRDVQIALGQRRQTRIHDVDFDVPMLQMADFEVDTSLQPERQTRTTDKQEHAAVACIEQSKLCLCISHILAIQYGVTSSKGSRRTSAMLFPASSEPTDADLQAVDRVLQQWKDRMPDSMRLDLSSAQNLDLSDNCLFVKRAVLHMLYYATISCLHRLQLLPPSTTLPRLAQSISVHRSRKALRLAAIKITAIAGRLLNLSLVRYLPSPTITVLLPAIVSHLSGSLSLEPSIRNISLQYYSTCMQVMSALRDMYAAADYSTAFLQAAILKAESGPLALQTEEDREAYTTLNNTQDVDDINELTETVCRSPGSDSFAVSHPHASGLMSAQRNDNELASLSHSTNRNIYQLPSASLTSTNISLQPSPSQPPRIQQGPDRFRTTMFEAWSVANGTSPTYTTNPNEIVTTDNRNDLSLPFAPGIEFPLDAAWLSDLGADEAMMTGYDGGAATF